jgi:c(7)-type cytochrome triheme protein
MRHLTIALAAAALSLGLCAADKPPETIVFEAKQGNVTFNHAKHIEREKKDCKVCHPKLFPQAKAPLNYKAAVHQAAEKAKTSCGACHATGGTAFAAKGNCAKCHVKGAAAAKPAD